MTTNPTRNRKNARSGTNPYGQESNEIRSALERWNARLRSIVSPPAANVVSIRSAL